MTNSSGVWMAISLLLGGLGLFLYGIGALADALNQAADDRFRRTVARATRIPMVGLLVGTVVTAFLESSSATTVMVVGLIDAGLMTLKQSVGVILGSAVGSTVTVQLVAFPWVDQAALPAMGVGAMLHLFAVSRPWRVAGLALFGFGAIFFGFQLMKDGVRPWQDTFLRDTFAYLARPGLLTQTLAVLAATLATAIVQSSAATVGLVMALTAEGVIPGLGAALPLLVGCNIGTTITAVLAAFGRSAAAQRSAAIHVVFRILGGAVTLALATLYVRWIPDLPGGAARDVAHLHTVTNAVNAVLFLPLAGGLVWLATRMIRSRREWTPAPEFLDFGARHSWPDALAAARRETLRVADTVRGMTADAVRGLRLRDERALESVLSRERMVDSLHVTIAQYLRAESTRHGPVNASRSFLALLQVLHHLERVGDHAENLVEIARLGAHNPVPLGAQRLDFIGQLATLVDETAEQAIHAIRADDRASADRALERRDAFRHRFGETLAATHAEAEAGRVPPLVAAMFEDALENLSSTATHWKKAAAAYHGLPLELPPTGSRASVPA